MAETIHETHEWLLMPGPTFDATIITVYPGTPYYDDAVPHPTEKGVWIYRISAIGSIAKRLTIAP